MKKQVLVNVVGSHKQRDGEWDEIEVTVNGILYEKNGTLFLVYDEVVSSDTSDVTHNRIKIETDPMTVTVTKSGTIVNTLIFNESEMETSNYITPYGNMMLSIVTQMLSVDYNRTDGLKLEVDYRLDMNYEYLSESRLRIKAVPVADVEE